MTKPTLCLTHTITLELDLSDLIKAARLGGLDIALYGDVTSHDLPRLTMHAESGIRRAIEECFDRAYPSRYPDDWMDDHDHHHRDLVSLLRSDRKREGGSW